MITVNWESFASKFSGSEQVAFEHLCYLLFCKKYGIDNGIARYYNNPGIETAPIEHEGEVIGWQAKYFQAPLSQRRSEIIDTLNKAHEHYPRLTRLIFFCNKDFGMGVKDEKGVGDPEAKRAAEEYAGKFGIEIEWFLASNFESPFVVVENESIAEHFFTTTERDLLSFGRHLLDQSKAYFESIETSVCLDEKEMKIDRSPILDCISDGFERGLPTIALIGDSGIGKSAIAKELFSRMSANAAVLAVDCRNASSWRSEEDVFGGWKGRGFSDVQEVFAHFGSKYLIVDSAEHLEESPNCSLPNALFVFARNGGWRALFTVRPSGASYVDECVRKVFGTPTNSISVVGFSDEQTYEYLDYLGYRNQQSKNVIPVLSRPIYAKALVRARPNLQCVLSESDLRAAIATEIFSSGRDIKKRVLEKDTIAGLVAPLLNLCGHEYDLDQDVLQRLESEGVVYWAENGEIRFTHDFFEELACDSFFDSLYASVGCTDKFFQTVRPALGTKKRLCDWLVRRAVVGVDILRRFSMATLTNDCQRSDWSDCITQALLRSCRAPELMDLMEREMLSDDWHLAKLFAKNLKLACMCIDFETLKMLAIPEGGCEEFLFQKPCGYGWKPFIDFLYRHKDEIPLDGCEDFVCVLRNWTNKYHEGEFVRKAGLTALALSEKIDLHKDESYAYRDDQELLAGIVMNAAKELPKELANLCVSFAENWNDCDIRFHPLSERLLGDSSLTCYVAGAIPREYAAFLYEAWCMGEDEQGYPFCASLGFEEEFRLRDQGPSYYPPSALQTPLYALFRSDWEVAIELVCKMADHVVSAIENSSLSDECISSSLMVPGFGSITIVFSERLWMAYLGLGTCPNLYASILMGFERWLIEQADTATQDQLEDICFKALSMSRSCSIVAVIVSAVLTAPEKCPNVLCALFDNPIVLAFDNRRFEGWRFRIRSLYFPEDQIHRIDRERAEASPIRAQTLGFIALRAQMAGDSLRTKDGMSARDKIHTAIDCALSNADPQDWWLRKQYEDIDSRNLQVIGESEDPSKPGLILETKRSEELVELIESSIDSEALQREDRAARFNAWAYSCWHEGVAFTEEIASFDQALDFAKAIKDGSDYLSDESKKYVVAIALRDGLGELSSDNLEYCVDSAVKWARSALSNRGSSRTAVEALIAGSARAAEKGEMRCLELLADLAIDPLRRYSAYAIREISIMTDGNQALRESFFVGYLLLSGPGRAILHEEWSRHQDDMEDDHLTTDCLAKLKTKQPEIVHKMMTGTLNFGDLEESDSYDAPYLMEAFPLTPKRWSTRDGIANMVKMMQAISHGLSEMRASHGHAEADARFAHQVGLWVAGLDCEDYRAILPSLAPLICTEHIGEDLLRSILDVRVSGNLDEGSFVKLWKEVYEVVAYWERPNHFFLNGDELAETVLFADDFINKSVVPGILSDNRWGVFFEKAAKDLHGPKTLYSFAYLADKVMTDRLMDGVRWCAMVIAGFSWSSHTHYEVNTDYHLNSIVNKAVYELGHEISEDRMFRDDLLCVLDYLIQYHDSPNAHRLRDMMV